MDKHDVGPSTLLLLNLKLMHTCSSFRFPLGVRSYNARAERSKAERKEEKHSNEKQQ